VKQSEVRKIEWRRLQFMGRAQEGFHPDEEPGVQCAMMGSIKDFPCQRRAGVGMASPHQERREAQVPVSKQRCPAGDDGVFCHGAFVGFPPPCGRLEILIQQQQKRITPFQRRAGGLQIPRTYTRVLTVIHLLHHLAAKRRNGRAAIAEDRHR
jgi:hypothetical protein